MTLQEAQQKIMKALVVYTDKLRYFGRNSVNFAISRALAEIIAELAYLRKRVKKSLFLTSATKTLLDNLGNEYNTPRAKKSYASTIIIARSETATIDSIALNVAPGQSEITLLDGSMIPNGAEIYIRTSLGVEPTQELKQVLSKPSINTLRVSTLTGLYKKGDFVILRVFVPKESKITSTAGVTFRTKKAFHIGDLNPVFRGEAVPLSLADKTIAIAETLGESGNIQPYSLLDFSPKITGVTAIFNPIPGEGGLTKEQDSAYRSRIQNEASRLALETEAWYLAMAQEVDKTVARVFINEGADINDVILQLVSRSGAPYSNAELHQIKLGIEERTRSITTVTAENLVFDAVSVEATVTLYPSETLQTAFNQVASRLSEFLDWRVWEKGKKIDNADLLSLVDGSPAINNTVSFYPTTDIMIDKLPRFAYLKLTNAEDFTQVLGEFINQSFE